MQWTSFVQVLRHRAAHQPERIAYGFLTDGETGQIDVSHANMDRQARCIAARLQALDAAGKRALLLYAPGVDYIAAFFGCLYAGVVAVPAYPPRNARAMPRIKAIAEDAGAELVLGCERDMATLQAMAAALPQLHNLTWLATDTLLPSLADTWQAWDIRSEDIAFLQYTSGSTGDPKGVVLTHANLLHNSAMTAQAFGTSVDSRGLIWLPPYHDMGLIGGILQPLFVGFPTWLMAPALFLQRPLRWLQAISRLRATHSGGPDFAYDLCTKKISAAQRGDLDLSCWRVAFNGAEPVRATTLAAFAAAFAPCGFDKASFLPCYGLAEACLIVTGSRSAVELAVDSRAYAQDRIEPSEAAEAKRLVSSGPLATSPGTCVVDIGRAAPCAEGRVGEIWVCNPSVAQGYWNKPALTDEVFGARLANGEGPFLRTGDLGFVQAGQLYVTGRSKDLVIVRGRNFYPTDIEAEVQLSHAALRTNFGVAFSIERDGEEQLVVVQELDFRHKTAFDDVRQAIVRAVTAQFEIVPNAVVLVKAGTLPTTSSGKLRRRETRQMFLDGSLLTLHQWQSACGATAASMSAETAHADPYLRLLVGQVAALSGVALAEVNIDRPFVDFGLGSADAVALSGDLEQQLGRRFAPTLLWDHPNIRLLAKFLGDSVDHGAPLPSALVATNLVEPSQGVEAIAVIGLGCRFPGASDVEAYWRLLRDGVDAISEVPADRWNTDDFFDPRPATPGKLSTRWGGFLKDIDAFDADLFGISADEASGMDPQQRLLLETAWAALEHAGHAPSSLAGSQTGVFIGVSGSDHARRLAGQPQAMRAHTGTGNANSVAANRISYQLGLLGPSMAVDTACSSSLVAVHLACQSLRLRESDMALAGGVNLMLEPDLTIAFSQAGMMAADGRCKTFDASADGYVRGEGCGVVVLKRWSDAKRDGDNVLALLRGSAVNQNGRSNGLTAPSRVAQRAVIQRALAQAGAAPEQLSYVEAHGTGTALGDPIEIQALVEAIAGPGREFQCAVASVKTNIGHLEAAAGIAGLIKVVLMLQHGKLVPHLHIQQLNPRLRRSASSVFVPVALQPWATPPGTARLAGVSSFGFGGANAHVVLEEPPPLPVRRGRVERPLHLLTLSARGDVALRQLADRYQRYFVELPAQQVGDACFTANAGRGSFADRLCVVGADAAELSARLDGFLRGEAPNGVYRSQIAGSAPPPRLAFVFGDAPPPQPESMAEVLHETQPNLHAMLVLHRARLQAQGPRACTRAHLFLAQLAAAAQWSQWGVKPAAVIGVGDGELAAACHAGAFDAEAGLGLICGDTAVHFGAVGLPLFFASNAEPAGAEVLCASRWIEGPRPAGPLDRSVALAQASGATVFIEVATTGSSVPPEMGTAHWFGASQPGRFDWPSQLDQLARLFGAGVDINWAGIDRHHTRRRVVVPTYPFQHQKYWSSAATKGRGGPNYLVERG
jgi:acyl-CoA synthetase (AMP-forming)/AMP-acid ligase II/3-oxoacyl-(acyl-carrier-protein) synthase/acyl carrier protein